MGLRVRVEISEALTFGDLYQFVDLARVSGIAPATKVGQVLVREQEPELGIDSFELEIGSAATFESPVTLSAADARELATALDAVLEDEGDARKHTDGLRRWRDRLAGLYAA